MQPDQTLSSQNPAVKTYIALLNQASTEPPTPIEIKNTIGTMLWTYDGTGGYSMTGPINCFPLEKTIIQIPTTWGKDIKFTAGSNEETDENSIFVTSNRLNTGAYISEDDLLYYTPIIINVYQ